MSTNIFNSNTNPLKINTIQIAAPDANITEVQNAFEGKLRTSFDIEINQPGTYKIFATSSGLNARWETEDGKPLTYGKPGFENPGFIAFGK